MKKLITSMLVGAVALFSTSTPVQAAAASNEVPFVVSYAGAYLYCNNSIGLDQYKNGQVFDNNGACLDLSSLILENPNSWYELLLQQYPGGINRWAVHADGKKCMFDIYQAHPLPGELTATEIVFAACAVKLGRPVQPTWYLEDYEDAGIAPVYLPSYLVEPVNAAVTILAQKFRKPYRMWLKPGYGTLNLTISASPSGSKIYLQKWVDYRWVTVKVYERYWEGRMTYLYKAQPGKYRAVAKSLSGMVYCTNSVRF